MAQTVPLACVVIVVLMAQSLRNVETTEPSRDQEESEVETMNSEQNVAVDVRDFNALRATVTEQGAAIAAILRQQSEILELLNKPKDANQPIQTTTTGGVSYVRWGRTTCTESSASEVLYKGYIGSGLYSGTGGGGNFLCLDEQPEWGAYVGGNQSSSFIYGTEYLLSAELGSPFSTENNQNVSLEWNDAVCAVCHNALRSNQLMMPGRRSCSEGWTQEYRGYLVSAAYYNYETHIQRSSYICLDEAPEVIPGGEVRENGAFLYPVQAACGSLPCPHYIQGQEVACVVCSK